MAKTVPICLHHIKSLAYSRSFHIISSRRQLKKSYFKPGHFHNLAYISETMVYLLKHAWIIYSAMTDPNFLCGHTQAKVNLELNIRWQRLRQEKGVLLIIPRNSIFTHSFIAISQLTFCHFCSLNNASCMKKICWHGNPNDQHWPYDAWHWGKLWLISQIPKISIYWTCNVSILIIIQIAGNGYMNNLLTFWISPKISIYWTCIVVNILIIIQITGNGYLTNLLTFLKTCMDDGSVHHYYNMRNI